MFGEAPRDWISKVYVSEALSGDAELMAQVEKLPYEIVIRFCFSTDERYADAAGNYDSA